MFGAIMMLLVTFGIVAAVVIYYRRSNIMNYVHAKRESAWTTFYFKSRTCTHIHLVPLDGRDHFTAEDGDCRCHTSKNEIDDTIVYQHQRIGV